jgi:hypothetical protein
MLLADSSAFAAASSLRSPADQGPVLGQTKTAEASLRHMEMVSNPQQISPLSTNFESCANS